MSLQSRVMYAPREGTAINAAVSHLVSSDGWIWPLAVERWLGPADAADLELIARMLPPVLDVGCGPGRHLVALAAAGLPALGIDVAPSAVQLARARGVCVLERSVFDRIPATGRWGTALLLDGNAGIGGDPEALLTRVASLVRPGGRVLIELEAPGVRSVALLARIHRDGDVSPWFRWARVGSDHLPGLAAACGLQMNDRWVSHGRWFGLLVR